MNSRPSGLAWMGGAFAATAAAAAVVLVWRGAGPAGTHVALRVTARLAFLFFWPGYVGGALTTLFGDAFRPAKIRARALGLAFAAALAVHLGLVSWLCWIGSPPAARTFEIFGAGVAWTAMLALLSIEPLGAAAQGRFWRTMRSLAVHYLAFLFILDFVRLAPNQGPAELAQYLPFAASRSWAHCSGSRRG